MALFKKKTTTQIPELQDYYATQKTDNTAVAWLLALLSLVVTAVIVVGLFVGGRFVYRKITNKDDKATSVVTQKPESVPNNTTNNDTSSQKPDTNLPTATVTVPETSSSTSDAIANPPKIKPAEGVSPSQSPSTNTNAVAANTTVPNTGAGSTISIFMAVTILAYAAHYRKFRSLN